MAEVVDRSARWQERQQAARVLVDSLRGKTAAEVSQTLAGWLRAVDHFDADGADKIEVSEAEVLEGNAVARVVTHRGNKTWVVAFAGAKFPDWQSVMLLKGGDEASSKAVATPFGLDERERHELAGVGFAAWDARNLEAIYMNIEFETRGFPDLSLVGEPESAWAEEPAGGVQASY